MKVMRVEGLLPNGVWVHLIDIDQDVIDATQEDIDEVTKNLTKMEKVWMAKTNFAIGFKAEMFAAFTAKIVDGV